MVARVTRQAVEILAGGTGNVRVTRQPVEILAEGTGNARVTRFAIEVLSTHAPTTFTSVMGDDDALHGGWFMLGLGSSIFNLNNLTAETTLQLNQSSGIAKSKLLTASNTVSFSQVDELVEVEGLLTTNPSVLLDDLRSQSITYNLDNAKFSTLERDLERFIEVGKPYLNADFDAVDTIYSLTPGDRTGGTCDLTFTNNLGVSFVVEDIPFNVGAVTLQLAVDAAATTALDNYEDGDISITGGPLGTTSFTIRFSGNSVRGDKTVSIDVTALTGGTTDPSLSKTQTGVVPRFWFSALREMGVIYAIRDVDFGEAPNGQYSVRRRDELSEYPSNFTILALLREASVQEGQDWEAEIGNLLGLDMDEREQELGTRLT